MNARLSIDRSHGWRYFFTRCGSVLAVVLIADVCVGLYFKPIWIRSTAQRILEFCQSPAEPRIVILGSSRPRENIDPAYLGRRMRELNYPYRVYNMAFTGGGAVKVESMLQRGIRPTISREIAIQPAHLFLIDIGDFEIDHRYQNRADNYDKIFDWVARYPDLKGWGWFRDALRRGLDAYERTLLQQAADPIYDISALRRFSLDWSKKEEARKTARKIVFYPIFRGKIPPKLLNPQPQVPRYLKDYEVGDTQMAALVHLVQAIREIGSVPILISVPEAEWRREFQDTDMEIKFHDAMNRFSRDNHVLFVPIGNADAGLTDDDFFDDLHMKRGSRSKLTEAILNKAILPAIRAAGKS